MIHIGGLESLSLAQVAEEVDTMVTGVMNGIHHVLPGMRERSRYIINISRSVIVVGTGCSGYHAVSMPCASGESMNMSEAEHNVRVNGAGTDPHRHSPEDGDHDGY